MAPGKEWYQMGESLPRERREVPKLDTTLSNVMSGDSCALAPRRWSSRSDRPFLSPSSGIPGPLLRKFRQKELGSLDGYVNLRISIQYGVFPGHAQAMRECLTYCQPRLGPWHSRG